MITQFHRKNKQFYLQQLRPKSQNNSPAKSIVDLLDDKTNSVAYGIGQSGRLNEAQNVIKSFSRQKNDAIGIGEHNAQDVNKSVQDVASDSLKQSFAQPDTQNNSQKPKDQPQLVAKKEVVQVGKQTVDQKNENDHIVDVLHPEDSQPTSSSQPTLVRDSGVIPVGAKPISGIKPTGRVRINLNDFDFKAFVDSLTVYTGNISNQIDLKANGTTMVYAKVSKEFTSYLIAFEQKNKLNKYFFGFGKYSNKPTPISQITFNYDKFQKCYILNFVVTVGDYLSTQGKNIHPFDLILRFVGGVVSQEHKANAVAKILKSQKTLEQIAEQEAFEATKGQRPGEIKSAVSLALSSVSVEDLTQKAQVKGKVAESESTSPTIGDYSTTSIGNLDDVKSVEAIPTEIFDKKSRVINTNQTNSQATTKADGSTQSNKAIGVGDIPKGQGIGANGVLVNGKNGVLEIGLGSIIANGVVGVGAGAVGANIVLGLGNQAQTAFGAVGATNAFLDNIHTTNKEARKGFGLTDHKSGFVQFTGKVDPVSIGLALTPADLVNHPDVNLVNGKLVVKDQFGVSVPIGDLHPEHIARITQEVIAQKVNSVLVSGNNTAVENALAPITNTFGNTNIPTNTQETNTQFQEFLQSNAGDYDVGDVDFSQFISSNGVVNVFPLSLGFVAALTQKGYQVQLPSAYSNLNASYSNNDRVPSGNTGEPFSPQNGGNNGGNYPTDYNYGGSNNGGGVSGFGGFGGGNGGGRKPPRNTGGNNSGNNFPNGSNGDDVFPNSNNGDDGYPTDGNDAGNDDGRIDPGEFNIGLSDRLFPTARKLLNNSRPSDKPGVPLDANGRPLTPPDTGWLGDLKDRIRQSKIGRILRSTPQVGPTNAQTNKLQSATNAFQAAQGAVAKAKAAMAAISAAIGVLSNPAFWTLLAVVVFAIFASTLIIAPYCIKEPPFPALRNTILEPAMWAGNLATSGNPLETSTKIVQLGVGTLGGVLNGKVLSGEQLLPPSEFRKMIEGALKCKDPNANDCPIDGNGNVSQFNNGSSDNGVGAGSMPCLAIARTGKYGGSPGWRALARALSQSESKGNYDIWNNFCCGGRYQWLLDGPSAYDEARALIKQNANLDIGDKSIALAEAKKKGGKLSSVFRPELQDLGFMMIFDNGTKSVSGFEQALLNYDIPKINEGFDKMKNVWTPLYPVGQGCFGNEGFNCEGKREVILKDLKIALEEEKKGSCGGKTANYQIDPLNSYFKDQRAGWEKNRDNYLSKVFGADVQLSQGRKDNARATGIKSIDDALVSFNKAMKGSVTVEAQARPNTTKDSVQEKTDRTRLGKLFKDGYIYSQDYADSINVESGAFNYNLVKLMLKVYDSGFTFATGINNGPRRGYGGHGAGAAMDFFAFAERGGKDIKMQFDTTDADEANGLKISKVWRIRQNKSADEIVKKAVNVMKSTNVLDGNQLIGPDILKAQGYVLLGDSDVKGHDDHIHFQADGDSLFNNNGKVDSGSLTSIGEKCCKCTKSGADSGKVGNVEVDKTYFVSDPFNKDLLKDKKFAMIHYTATAGEAEPLAKKFTEYAKNPKLGDYAHYLIASSGKTYQIVDEKYKVNGVEGISSGIWEGDKSLTVPDESGQNGTNIHSVQYEVHYKPADGIMPAETISDEQVKALAGLIVKSGFKQDQILTHWAVLPDGRTDASDWLRPDGKVTKSLKNFVKYTGWAKDDKEAETIGRQILKRNIDNAIKVAKDPRIIHYEFLTPIKMLEEAQKQLEKDLKSPVSFLDSIGSSLAQGLDFGVKTSSQFGSVQVVAQSANCGGSSTGGDSGSGGTGKVDLKNLTQEQVALALISILEGGPNDTTSQLDVAQVIANRVGNNYSGFGKTIVAQVTAPNQFAVIPDKQVNLPAIKNSEDLIKELKRIKGYDATNDVKNFFAGIADPTKSKDSAKFIGNRANFKSAGYPMASSYSGRVERNSTSNYFHIEGDSQASYKNINIASIIGGSTGTENIATKPTDTKPTYIPNWILGTILAQAQAKPDPKNEGSGDESFIPSQKNQAIYYRDSLQVITEPKYDKPKEGEIYIDKTNKELKVGDKVKLTYTNSKAGSTKSYILKITKAIDLAETDGTTQIRISEKDFGNFGLGAVTGTTGKNYVFRIDKAKANDVVGAAAPDGKAVEIQRNIDANCANGVTNDASTVNSKGWVVPVPKSQYSSKFGQRWGRPHQGIDMAIDLGTPMLAANSGEVVGLCIGAESCAGAYGTLLTIKHDGGLVSNYAHQRPSDIKVKVGDKVKAGDVIGAVGTEGRSTGPHLHFEIRKGETFGEAVDPCSYITCPAEDSNFN